MSDTDTGGSAFPFTPNLQPHLPDGRWDTDYDAGEPGMTLLDWFAGKAGPMPRWYRGQFSTDRDGEPLWNGRRVVGGWMALEVRWAYDYAATMLAEKRRREKGANDE